MKVLYNFPPEVIDCFNKFGTVVNELDENGNIVSFYNFHQWFKQSVDKQIFEVPFDELPDSAKKVHLSYRDYQRVFTIEEMRECFYAPIHNKDIGRCDTFAEFIKKRFDIDLQKK